MAQRRNREKIKAVRDREGGREKDVPVFKMVKATDGKNYFIPENFRHRFVKKQRMNEQVGSLFHLGILLGIKTKPESIQVQ